MRGDPIGTTAGFDAAVQAMHDANAVADGLHTATAQAAVADLPASRVEAAPASPGGDHDGDSPGR